MIKFAVCLSISVVIVALSCNVVPASGKKAIDPAVLYENKCSICHAIERSKSKKKSEKGWRKTVIRMKKNGAPISDAEVEIIIRHLADNYGK